MKYLNKLFLIFFIFTNLLQATINHNNFIENPNIIFFDIQDTLIQLQTYKIAFSYFGISDSVTALFQQNPNDFYNNKLSQIPSKYGMTDYKIVGLDGNYMPALQRDYLLGKLNSRECLEISHKWIENNKHKFKSDNQIKLFKKMIDFYFDPKIFYKYNSYTDCKKLMKQLNKAKYKKGKRKNIIIIISNQSKEQISILRSSFPEIFDYSDIEIFSANEGYLKPDLPLFEKAISLCPKTSSLSCFLIDNSNYAFNKIKVVNHTIEILKPKDAKDKLKSEDLF